MTTPPKECFGVHNPAYELASSPTSDEISYDVTEITEVPSCSMDDKSFEDHTASAVEHKIAKPVLRKKISVTPATHPCMGSFSSSGSSGFGSESPVAKIRNADITLQYQSFDDADSIYEMA